MGSDEATHLVIHRKMVRPDHFENDSVFRSPGGASVGWWSESLLIYLNVRCRLQPVGQQSLAQCVSTGKTESRKHQSARAKETLPPLPRLRFSRRLVPSADALGYVQTPSGLKAILTEIMRSIGTSHQTTKQRMHPSPGSWAGEDLLCAANRVDFDMRGTFDKRTVHVTSSGCYPMGATLTIDPCVGSVWYNWQNLEKKRLRKTA